MADIQKLADSAASKLRSHDATTYIDAARKAVIGAGITNRSEVREFSHQVVLELGRRGGNKTGGLKKAQRIGRAISKKIGG